MVDEILERFPVTLTLAILGMIFAIAIGLPLGILAALKQNTWVDALASFFALVGFSIPNFWWLMLMLLLSIYIPILPSPGVRLVEEPHHAHHRPGHSDHRSSPG
ncbi:hypothetical protein MASR2M17_24420 [Aminivibrio sp.]